MKNALEVSHLTKDYGSFKLDDVSFTVPGGTIMGLIGENGAGKSTTIKCILNLIRRDAGEITLLGRDNLREERAAKAGVGVVLDECVFHDALRPRDLERILAPVYPTWDNGLYRDYLDKFRLPGKNLIKTFSRGMKMKLSLAAALAHRPQLLILDEATAGLDPVVRDEILDEFLNFICDEDHAILISSHITSDLEKAADYIAQDRAVPLDGAGVLHIALHQGRVVLSQPKDELLDRYGRVGCSTGDLAAIEPGDLLRVRRGTFGCEGLTSDRYVFQKKYPGLTVDPASLEDIMLLIGKGESLCTD